MRAPFHIVIPSKRRPGAGQAGLTLIELIVVIAILGVILAIAGPSFLGFLGSADDTALAQDQRAVQVAVDAFAAGQRRGPSDGRWGAGPQGIFLPTVTGEAGLLELSPSDVDPEAPLNPRLDHHAAGPGSGGPAGDDDVGLGLIWMGLLLNEPFGEEPGPENGSTGTAHPLGGESGLFLLDCPESAAEPNCAQAGPDVSQSPNHYVVLHNGRVVPAYRGGEAWFAAVGAEGAASTDAPPPTAAPTATAPPGSTSTPEPSPTPGVEPIVMEAEEMLLDGYVIDPLHPEWIRNPGVRKAVFATGPFPGLEGEYEIHLGIIAESDGASTLELWVEGVLQLTILYPLSEALFEPITIVGPTLLLRPGDEIKLVGFSRRGAWSRVDRLLFFQR